MRVFGLLLLFLLAFSSNVKASHVMGGDITWTCQGGNYVFQLVFYRDCNGAVVNTSMETIQVWGHPTITSIQVNYVGSEDVSPYCTQVAGGPAPLDCGSGQAGGNGIGAIEKATYISAPIALSGTPPSGGWTFTFDTFSRSSSLTNISNPTSYGITLIAKMFAIPGGSGGTCVDNSPQFLQEPYFVSCAGEQYEYNMNGVDPDLDSLNISFGAALDFLDGQPYNPPAVPAVLPYEPGFSPTSPTPGTSMNAGNIPASIDPSSGNLTFLSFNTGNFAVKIVARSYRNGVLIAQVEREMQLIVTNCSGTNTSPNIAGPFGGLFETTVNAGTLVNFNLSSTDIEVLQDGSPQDNILTATGLMFGANNTDPNSGCAITPCATLNTSPPITMPQGVNTDFSWQTNCNHLINPYGDEAAFIPYHFVFKVQDNYCQVPKVSYATVTINVVNPGIVAAPEIECIQTNAAGDVTINWTQPNDPAGTFTGYNVYSVQNGLLATIPAIGTTSYTHVGVMQANDYYVASVSGCSGGAERNSDTISNIFLEVSNPGNGTAQLQWNDPVNPALNSMGNYYHIYREYPAGNWTLQDSLPYGTHFYFDTIDICSAYLNYQIVLPNQPCDYTSNIDGGQFEDMLAPDMPYLYSVTIDTATNAVTITWNQNSQPDTYGYIIYTQDPGGALVEIDQIFGITDTSYTFFPDISLGPLTYTVAAFDSCINPSTGTYSASGKADPVHTTVFLQTGLNVCERTVDLSWTDYGGWIDFDHYEVYGNYGSGWNNYGQSSGTNFQIDVIEGETYTFAIQGISLSGDTVFSNTSSLYIEAPGQPAFNYLQVATVNGNEIELRVHIDNSMPISSLAVQRMNEGVFEEIGTIAPTSPTVSYLDEDVEVDKQSYIYRIQVKDSCGRDGSISNEAETILLQVDNDDIQKVNYIYWSNYREFNGSILGYDIYRGYDGVFNNAPIATVPAGQFYFTDDVNSVVSNGRICYKVVAVESMNIFGFNERSQSNVACIVLPPLIYIPNAFTPDGLNPIFLPIISDFDPVDYDMTIFDRWGQALFRTSDPNIGWDGRIMLSGKMAETGTYVYMVTLHNGEGIEIIKRGHVTLLK